MRLLIHDVPSRGNPSEGGRLLCRSAADIFSAGCIVFFMLRGRPPFDWEAAEARGDCSTLVARLKANDPFCPTGDEEDEDPFSDDEDEEPPPPTSATAVELIKLATRYVPAERPSATELLASRWLRPAADASEMTGLGNTFAGLGM